MNVNNTIGHLAKEQFGYNYFFNHMFEIKGSSLIHLSTHLPLDAS